MFLFVGFKFNLGGKYGIAIITRKFCLFFMIFSNMLGQIRRAYFLTAKWTRFRFCICGLTFMSQNMVFKILNLMSSLWTNWTFKPRFLVVNIGVLSKFPESNYVYTTEWTRYKEF